MNPAANHTVPANDFNAFFSSAFEDARQPYDYQRRLADSGCEFRLISIPTGLGKTASVVLAWLWKSRASPESRLAAPPRLLPAHSNVRT